MGAERNERHNMIVGILGVEIIIYESNSLKEKRHVVKSLIERLRNKFNISIGEMDYLDLWNKSYIGISLISNDKKVIDGTISKVIDFIDKDDRVEIIKTDIEIL